MRPLQCPTGHCIWLFLRQFLPDWLQTVDMGRRRIPLRRVAWPTDPQGLHWKAISNEKKARANGGLNPHLADVEETFIKATSYPTNDAA
jgi:hypothetical protein